VRVKVRELSPGRVAKALMRRLAGIPSRLSFALSQAGRRNRIGLEAFRDSHKGETCILLANGPSLANEDLRLTFKYPTFGLNRVYLGANKLSFNLDYLVCVNRLVLSQFGSEIEGVRCKKFLSWDSRTNFMALDDILWLNPGLQFKSFSKDITRGLNPAATVTFAALQIIYFMGFEKVVILGMDHSFSLKKSTVPNTTEIYNHEEDVNHFLPNYFPKGVKWETPDLVSSEHFYSIAREVYEQAGRRIVDCTTGGQCLVFEKGVLSNELESSQ